MHIYNNHQYRYIYISNSNSSNISKNNRDLNHHCIQIGTSFEGSTI